MREPCTVGCRQLQGRLAVAASPEPADAVRNSMLLTLCRDSARTHKFAEPLTAQDIRWDSLVQLVDERVYDAWHMLADLMMRLQDLLKKRLDVQGQVGKSTHYSV